VLFMNSYPSWTSVVSTHSNNTLPSGNRKNPPKNQDVKGAPPGKIKPKTVFGKKESQSVNSQRKYSGESKPGYYPISGTKTTIGVGQTVGSVKIDFSIGNDLTDTTSQPLGVKIISGQSKPWSKPEDARAKLRGIVIDHSEPAVIVEEEMRELFWASVRVKNDAHGYEYKPGRNPMYQVHVWLPSIIVKDEKVIANERKASLPSDTAVLVRCFPDFRYAWAKELRPFIGSESNYPGKIVTMGISCAIESALKYSNGATKIPPDDSW